MKLIKVINKSKKILTKSGKEIYSSYYALKHDNGKITPIKPLYKNGYAELDFVAEVKVLKDER